MVSAVHQGEPDRERTHQTERVIPYSAFSRNTKIFTIGICCFVSTFFGFCTYIYYPAVEPLIRALHSTESLINLTNVPFQIAAGLAPAIVGCTADFYGRRSVYIVCLLIFTASNIGLALIKSYPALLGLRMSQMAGASGIILITLMSYYYLLIIFSGTIALAYGVISDVIPAADRGQYTGLLNAWYAQPEMLQFLILANSF